MTTTASPIRGRLYERIAAALRQSLASGRYAIGDRLPSERDLAQQYGVSRPVVREAILALEGDRLIEVRTNSGVYVTALTPAGGAPTQADIGPFELLEARRLLEGEVCALAARHIDAEGITRLRSLIVEMESADPARTEAADREFHLEIARATRNSALEKVVADLWDTRDSSAQYRLLTEKVRHADAAPRVPEHRRIVDALDRAEPTAAREAMHDHLGRVINWLLDATEVEAMERVRADLDAKRHRIALPG